MMHIFFVFECAMVVVAATLGLPPHSEKVGSSIPATATVQGSVRFSHISRVSFYQHLFHTPYNCVPAVE